MPYLAGPSSPPPAMSLRPATTWLLVALALIVVAVSGCHPGTAEAKRLRDACDDGDLSSCDKFATRLRNGEHVLRDQKRATELFDKACNGNVGDACASLAVMLQRGGGGIKRDSARAVTLFQHGCDKGGMSGCTRLGALHTQGA